MTDSGGAAAGAGLVAADSRIWRDGVLRGEGVASDRIAQAAHDPDMLVWVDLLRPSSADLAELARDLGLPPTTPEDALAPHERAKLVRHETYLFFTVYAATLSPGGVAHQGRLRLARISGIVLPMALVTIRLDPELSLAPLLSRWDDSADLLEHGAAGLVHGLLDWVVDGHFEAIQEFDDEIERLEDVLFEDRRTDARFAHRVYGLRKDLVALRRVVLPMREVVNALQRHGPERTALSVWFDDLYDHVLRASEWTESLRDMVTSIFETNLSLQDSRLNTIMKQLSGWAAIIAIPTAITGWFGQNLPFPGYEQPLGFALSTGLIVGGVGVLYAVFRAKDWL